MTGETTVAVAAGSNLGDRLAHLLAGVEALADLIRIEAVSEVVESPSEGDPEQPDYLNLVVRGRTDLAPRRLLSELLEIERRRGRTRRKGGGAARTLDLDLILYGDAVLREPGLHVPHPRWRDRPFVARPLLQLFPDGVDPETGAPLAESLTSRARSGPLHLRGRLDVDRVRGASR